MILKCMHDIMFNKKNFFFYQQIGLKYKEEDSEVLHSEHSFEWC